MDAGLTTAVPDTGAGTAAVDPATRVHGAEPQTERAVQAPDIRQAAAHFRAGATDDAEACCLALLEQDPEHFDALHLLGVLCIRRNAFADAVGFLRRAERVRADLSQLHANLGRAYLGLSLYGNAERCLRRAIGGKPDAALLSDLGTAVAGAGRYNSAEAILRQALVIAPDSPPALYNLARCLAAQGQHVEAARLFNALVSDLGGDPRRQELVSNSLASSLSALERYDDALAACRAMLASHPGAATVAWNESLALLSLGRYEEGWAGYEARWRVAAHDRPHPRHSVLDLGAVAGRSVLVLAEQGHGDLLQFARYVPMLRDRGAEVTLQVYREVTPVLRGMTGVRVITLEDAQPRTDLVTSLLSLPLAFGTTLETVPRSVPYLSVPPDRLNAWRQRLGERTGPRVGLAWRGLQHIPHRSLPLGVLGMLLQLKHVGFHALQKDITPSDRDWLERNGVQAHDTAIRDFGDTAALIAHMDLVVTIDTSVAHLAGGLGAPVCVMLARNADWRWLTGRDDSPWYPTMRLVRQTQSNEWADVAGRITAALAGIYGTSAAGGAVS